MKGRVTTDALRQGWSRRRERQAAPDYKPLRVPRKARDMVVPKGTWRREVYILPEILLALSDDEADETGRIEVETEVIELRFNGSSRVEGYSERTNTYLFWEVTTDEEREHYGLWPITEEGL